MPVVGIEWAVKLDSLRRQLADVPGVGGDAAKALTAQLSKEIRAAEREYKRASTSMSGSLEKAMDAGGKSAVKLRGLLSSISPQLGGIAGAADDVADAFEAVSIGGPALMAVAAAAAAAGLAYSALSADIREAQEWTDRQRAVLDAVSPLYDEVSAATRAAAVATGELSEATARELDIRDRWNASLGTTINRLNQQAENLRAEIEPGIIDTSLAYFGLKDDIDNLTRSMSEQYGWLAVGSKLWNDDRKATEAKELELTRLLITQDQATAAATRGAEAEITATRAAGSRTKATREETDSVRELEAALRAETEARDEALAAADRKLKAAVDARLAAAGQTASLLSRSAGLGMSPQERAEAEAAAFTAQIDHQIAENERLGIAVWDLYQARKRAEEEYQQVVEAGYEAQLAAQVDQIGGVIGAYAELGEAVKEQGRAGFAVWKAAALAQTIINTAQGVMKGFADLGPIGGAIAAPAIVAIGAVQAGQIAAQQPTFGDTPGMMQMSGGGSVRLAPGDYFAAAQSPADLAAQTGAGSGSLILYDHRVMGRYIRDTMRGPSSLARAIGASASVSPGRRSRSR